jgi:hypothetical protein
LLETGRAAALVAEGVAHVQAREAGFYQLELPLADVCQPATIAVGVIAGLARTPAEAVQEQARLGKWLCAIHHRLVTASQSAVRRRHHGTLDRDGAPFVGLEALMSLEHLLRTQRIEKAPARNRSQILRAAAGVLRARTILWVPGDETDALCEGESLLSPGHWSPLARLLAEDPEAVTSGYLRHNQVQTTSWGARFPQIATLLAVVVPLRGAPSWLIALNKTSCPDAASSGSSRGSTGSGSGPAGQAVFRRTDVALILPFAALLGLHLRTTRQHQQFKEILTGLTRALASPDEAPGEFAGGETPGATACPWESPLSPWALPG